MNGNRSARADSSGLTLFAYFMDCFSGYRTDSQLGHIQESILPALIVYGTNADPHCLHGATFKGKLRSDDELDPSIISSVSTMPVSNLATPNLSIIEPESALLEVIVFSFSLPIQLLLFD
jgi:hypothetical protein